jgi:hypothetical protein
MVWWWNDGSDGRDEDWYYIEAAFDTSYVDADEEFIFPSSTYKYKVEARADDHGDGPLYGKWSNAVTVTTPAEPAASLAYGGASSIARAASKAKITPAPSAPTLSISAKGVVTVSIANDSSKSRKFDIYLSNGNPLDTVSGGKATLTKELKNLQAGSSVAIKVQEVPYGANTNYKYSTNLYNTASDFSSLAYIVVPPKLEAFAAPTGTTGKGSNTVKSFTVTVKGWPSSGAASHTYAIKASSGTQQPSGKWVGDTYTGTIKTANKVSFTITPILSGNKTQTPLTTAKI